MTFLLLWTCPHGDSEALELREARRHLADVHPACLSCESERLGVTYMLQHPDQAEILARAIDRVDSQART
jgi:hypothetical protein